MINKNIYNKPRRENKERRKICYIDSVSCNPCNGFDNCWIIDLVKERIQSGENYCNLFGRNHSEEELKNFLKEIGVKE